MPEIHRRIQFLPLGLASLDSQGRRLNPKNGRVENITTTGGIWGYGMVQVGSTEDIAFDNLDGTGLER